MWLHLSSLISCNTWALSRKISSHASTTSVRCEIKKRACLSPLKASRDMQTTILYPIRKKYFFCCKHFKWCAGFIDVVWYCSHLNGIKSLWKMRYLRSADELYRLTHSCWWTETCILKISYAVEPWANMFKSLTSGRKTKKTRWRMWCLPKILGWKEWNCLRNVSQNI